MPNCCHGSLKGGGEEEEGIASKCQNGNTLECGSECSTILINFMVKANLFLFIKYVVLH